MDEMSSEGAMVASARCADCGAPTSGGYCARHLLFAIHLHCFAFMVLAIGFLPLPETLRAHLDWVILVYLFLALRRVYHSSWKATLWRVAARYVLYVAAMGVTAVSGVLATLLGSEAT